ncbi:serine/threonine-protein kinase [Dermabacteraceae bacterium P7074]
MADPIAQRFAFLDIVARGGAATVWRAHDTRENILCALKVMRQRDANDLLRAARETAAAFAHPRAAAPYAWTANDAEVALALPLITGGNLAGALRRTGALGVGQTAQLLAQLLDVLGTVHAAGWVHRDVKPANLLLREGTRLDLVLADFGLAQKCGEDRLTRHGHINGTPGYVAPEAYLGDPPRPAHDLYAAGVTALVALSPGVRLADRDGEAARRAAERVPLPLREVLRGLVSARPAERVAAARCAPALLAAACGDAASEYPVPCALAPPSARYRGLSLTVPTRLNRETGGTRREGEASLRATVAGGAPPLQSAARQDGAGTQKLAALALMREENSAARRALAKTRRLAGGGGKISRLA